jgi:Kef-type K+ transport system membrane component KefB/voltage-gated potassium channel Kch
MDNIFFSISIIIILATTFAYLGRLFKQPLIPAYILTGVVLGPLMGIITNTSVIATMSEIGIAFLLFIVGLQIDIKKLSNVGLISILGGTIQIVTTFGFTFLVAMSMGFIVKEAIYLSLIVVFSSTMVIVKLLSDRREIDTLHGRILIGFLLMQDIAAILALATLNNANGSPWPLIFSFLKGIGMIAIAYLGSKYIFPTIFKFAAKSRELLFLLAISFCLLFALFASYIGLSIIIGAFVAGVALANLPYSPEIIGRVKPLRDFFATIFFVSLGLNLVLGSANLIIKPLIVFTVIVIFFKPVIIMFICSFFGYKRRIGFQSSIAMSQISEFSLIIVSQGLILGHISQEIFSLTILIAIVTITYTSYLFKYEERLYRKLSNILRPFDMFTTGEEEELEYLPRKKRKHVILCGYNRIGFSIVRTIKKMKKDLLVVDFNPEVIVKLIKEKTHCIYGDIGDTEIIDRLDIKNASMIVSTVPTKRDNILLIRSVKEVNKDAQIFLTANNIDEAIELYDEGADYVILPHFLGGEHFSYLMEDFTADINKLIKTKLAHIKELKERQGLGHGHPTHH